MNNSTLRITESENLIVYKEENFSQVMLENAKSFLKELNKNGIIKGNFDEDEWIGYNGIKKTILNFEFDKNDYQKKLYKELGVPYNELKTMIKCHALYSTGELILNSISKNCVRTVKRLATEYLDDDFNLTGIEKAYIEEFLLFIDTPEEMVDKIVTNVTTKKIRQAKGRTLSHLINYLVIENEINDMYNGCIEDTEFIKFFPIYFWVNITFVLPLRATEMMVTPFDCVEYNNNTIKLTVRRTKLKGGKRIVYYDIEKDYELFTYNIEDLINRKVFDNIIKYQELTHEHQRRFLFDFNDAFSNGMMSLSRFNNLLSVFIDEKIIGNIKYEFAKNISGIEEFEHVTAGDSRPIAMANLLFQGVGIDLCRQLANHTNASTSEGYATNVSDTLYYSSIMDMQRMINNNKLRTALKQNKIIISDEFGCSSPKRVNDKTNIEDCKGHYQDCFGCKYYNPNVQMVKESMKQREEELKELIIILRENLISTTKIKGKDVDMDELFLKIHTSSNRYKESTDEYARKEAEKWEEEKNTQMIYS